MALVPNRLSWIGVIVIATVDNHIRSYENVIAYLDIPTCRYQGTAINEYSVPQVDALREFKDDTLRNYQVRTARTQTTPEKYPAAPANELPGGKGGEQLLHGISAGERTDPGPRHSRHGPRQCLRRLRTPGESAIFPGALAGCRRRPAGIVGPALRADPPFSRIGLVKKAGPDRASPTQLRCPDPVAIFQFHARMLGEERDSSMKTAPRRCRRPRARPVEGKNKAASQKDASQARKPLAAAVRPTSKC